MLDWNENDAMWPSEPAGRPLIARAVRVRGVFDHDQPVLAREGHDRVHVGGLTGEVDGDDRLGARRDRGFDRRADPD